jgi:tRNA U38,U39,U40 pseudouridine synthase TruA
LLNTGGQHFLPRYTDQLQQLADLTPEQQQAVRAAPDVDATLADAMLQRLQGKRLDFYSYARDTPQGKDCECTLLVARARLVRLPAPCSVGDASQQQDGCPCLAVELVADRFLRRMVRVLVGTLVREVAAAAAAAAAAGQQCPDHDQLLRLAGIRERRATAVSAPALGLCFASVGFGSSS